MSVCTPTTLIPGPYHQYTACFLLAEVLSLRHPASTDSWRSHIHTLLQQDLYATIIPNYYSKACCHGPSPACLTQRDRSGTPTSQQGIDDHPHNVRMYPRPHIPHCNTSWLTTQKHAGSALSEVDYYSIVRLLHLQTGLFCTSWRGNGHGPNILCHPVGGTHTPHACPHVQHRLPRYCYRAILHVWEQITLIQQPPARCMGTYASSPTGTLFKLNHVSLFSSAGSLQCTNSPLQPVRSCAANVAFRHCP